MLDFRTNLLFSAQAGGLFFIFDVQNKHPWHLFIDDLFASTPTTNKPTQIVQN